MRRRAVERNRLNRAVVMTAVEAATDMQVKGGAGKEQFHVRRRSVSGLHRPLCQRQGVVGGVAQVVVAAAGAVATERETADCHLAFVEDLLAAVSADRTLAGAADDRRHRRGQDHRLPTEDVGGRHALVAEQHRVPAVMRFRRAGGGALPRDGAGRNADRLASLRVDESGRDFTVVLDAQRPPPHPAVGRHGQTARETAVGLDDGEQAFVRLWQVEVKQFSGEPPHLCAEHLARAEMAVQRSRSGQEFVKRFHRVILLALIAFDQIRQDCLDLALGEAEVGYGRAPYVITPPAPYGSSRSPGFWLAPCPC